MNASGPRDTLVDLPNYPSFNWDLPLVSSPEISEPSNLFIRTKNLQRVSAPRRRFGARGVTEIHE
jgi:hypothetical protein